MTPLPVPLIASSGTPAECGAGYGAAAADRVRGNLELYRRRFRDEAGLDAADVHSAGQRFRGVTASLHPRIAAMLDGVAEGAGEPVEDVYALNARTELLYAAAVTAARANAWHTGRKEPLAAGASPEGPDGGCTAIGVLGTHTASGHLLLAQNWDWHPDQRDAMVLLATRDERGHGVLTLAEAGMLAKTGLNSAGVGVCVNMLGCDRDGLRSGGSPPGLPYHVLLRAALEADSLSWALRTVCRSPRSASINLLIGQAGGVHTGGPDIGGGHIGGGDTGGGHTGGGDPAGGELIDLELVPGEVGWLHPVDGVLTHANHLETGLPVYDTIKDSGGSSLFRSARARRLITGAAAANKVTEDDLAAVLRDHASFPLSICRHVDDRDPPAECSESVYSVAFDLDVGRFGLAAGPPCGHTYSWINLADALP
jgi:isopenicillin-N N-acyltransferase-like protein